MRVSNLAVIQCRLQLCVVHITYIFYWSTANVFNWRDNLRSILRPSTERKHTDTGHTVIGGHRKAGIELGNAMKVSDCSNNMR